MRIDEQGIQFIPEQVEAIKRYASELESMVKRFGISPMAVSRERAEDVAATDPDLIFTLSDWSANPVEDAVSLVEFPLQPQLSEGVDFYLATEPTFGFSGVAYLGIRLRCPNSDEELWEPGSDCCDSCSGGEVFINFTWDESGEVTAIASNE